MVVKSLEARSLSMKFYQWNRCLCPPTTSEGIYQLYSISLWNGYNISIHMIRSAYAQQNVRRREASHVVHSHASIYCRKRRCAVCWSNSIYINREHLMGCSGKISWIFRLSVALNAARQIEIITFFFESIMSESYRLVSGQHIKYVLCYNSRA